MDDNETQNSGEKTDQTDQTKDAKEGASTMPASTERPEHINEHGLFTCHTIDGKPVIVIGPVKEGEAGYNPNGAMRVYSKGDDPENTFTVPRDRLKGPGALAADYLRQSPAGPATTR